MTDDRLGQVQELVARNQTALIAGAHRLQEYARRTREPVLESPDVDVLTASERDDIAATYDAEANELLALRRGLLDLCELSLPGDKVEQIKGAFVGVGIGGAQDRRDMAEMVAERPITALADLTAAEADRLLVEIRKHEEPF